MKNQFGLIGISADQYTEQVRPMNYDVSFQDEGTTAVLDIEGFIGRDLMREFITGEKSKNTAKNLKEEIRSFAAEKVIVNIHSPGGDLSEGLVIKDMLQAKNARVVTNLQGFSASAATVIAQAGDTRRMAESSSFMLVHRAMMGLMGFFNQNSFTAMNEDLQTIDEQMVRMYHKRTRAIKGGASEQDIIDLMDDGEGYGKWINAATALEMGFIDETFDPGDAEDTDIDRLENSKKAARATLNVQFDEEKFTAMLDRFESSITEKLPTEETAAAEEARGTFEQFKRETEPKELMQ